MKSLQATDLQVTNRQFKIDAVIRQIETIFQEMQFPDVEGIQIYQLLSDNLHYEGDGVYAVRVNQLQGEVEFLGSPHSVWLRNHNGVLQYSNDHSAWADVGSGGGGGGGAGDMTKAVYDPQDTGRVLKAEKLADATHETTAAQMAGHLADSTIHFAQTEIDYGNLQNRPTHTPAEIDAFLDAGATLPDVLPITQVTDDPASVMGKVLLYGKQIAQGGQRAIKRGSRPLPPPVTIPWVMYSDGEARELCVLETDGTLLLSKLPTEAMVKGEYDAASVLPTGVVKYAQNIKQDDGGQATGEQIIRHLLGDLSLYGSGADLAAVAGVAIKQQETEPTPAVTNAAIVYCWAVTAGDPPVTTYELRVLFPDGTRRKITTEAIV